MSHIKCRDLHIFRHLSRPAKTLFSGPVGLDGFSKAVIVIPPENNGLEGRSSFLSNPRLRGQVQQEHGLTERGLEDLPYEGGGHCSLDF